MYVPKGRSSVCAFPCASVVSVATNAFDAFLTSKIVPWTGALLAPCLAISKRPRAASLLTVLASTTTGVFISLYVKVMVIGVGSRMYGAGTNVSVTVYAPKGRSPVCAFPCASVVSVATSAFAAFLTSKIAPWTGALLAPSLAISKRPRARWFSNVTPTV